METIAKSLFGTMEKVSFRRDNLTLAGHLFKPADFDVTKVYPTLIVHAAVTMVKEQAPDNYARLLVLHDFVVLTFDYASYGESEGSPRNNENVQGKLKDLKAGVSYLQTLPFVGEIGVLGVCASGGNAAYLAADDDRIAAMAAVVPWMYEPALAEPIWGKEVIARNDAKARDAREGFAKTGEYLSTQIFTNTPDIEGFMLGAAEYFFDKTRGISVRNWKNEVFWGAWDEWAHVYDPISQAPKIRIPVLVFSTDGALIPEQAKKFYDRVESEKQLVWGKGYHFNFYDVFPEMMQAVDAVVPFMRKHLAPQTVSRASRNRARTVVAAIK
jgi:uncharacterized protein